MAVVALAAAALSYQSLMHLGELAGYGWLSPLYPVVVDAGAAASCAAWLHTRGRQPLMMTWCLLGISVLLNGTVHYLESTHTAPSWLLVVAVAAVPPTVLGLTVHLAVGIGRPDLTRTSPAGAPAPAARDNRGNLDTTETSGFHGGADLRRPDQLRSHPEQVEPTTPGTEQRQVRGTQTSEVETQERRPEQERDQLLLDGSTTAAGFNGSKSTAQTNAAQTYSDPVSELIMSGVGRRKLAEALNISEHQARKLVEAARNGARDMRRPDRMTASRVGQPTGPDTRDGAPTSGVIPRDPTLGSGQMVSDRPGSFSSNGLLGREKLIAAVRNGASDV